MESTTPPVEQSAQDRLYDDYCRLRKEILEHRSIAVQMLDKTLLTVDTGAFVISFTFLFQLTGKGAVHHIAFIILGWAAMALAIFFNITAQFLVSKVYDWRQRQNDLIYKQDSGRIEPEEVRDLARLNKRCLSCGRTAVALSNLQFFLTGAAIALLVVFVSVNMVLFAQAKV